MIHVTVGWQYLSHIDINNIQSASPACRNVSSLMDMASVLKSPKHLLVDSVL